MKLTGSTVLIGGGVVYPIPHSNKKPAVRTHLQSRPTILKDASIPACERNSSVVWNADILDRFLASPRGFCPQDDDAYRCLE
jgi:hypothetical protein